MASGKLPHPSGHSERVEIAHSRRRNAIRRARRRTPTRKPESGDRVVAKALNYDRRVSTAERPDNPRRNLVGELIVIDPEVPRDIETAWGRHTKYLVIPDGEAQPIFVEPDTIRLLDD
ncbi:hypothetical protein Rhow_001255 [Rhodococcus wratislaviensis]|uniref:Uncharacterized protein n=1 Tax=Rhodococcus wratislaviensis TaxID=44752 RepID=A0A402C3P4_RHOWR|nr:hypothetical protein [Rhodococcus wratislaviensis]GCE38216.1 hypothetical protein Rhow_001255 [Rhodococcus wratislaviensis]